MKKLIVATMAIFIMTGFFSAPATAGEASLTSCDWEPYAAEKLLNYGFTSDIISKAFERVNYKASFRYLPWKRAMMETKRGKHDAL